MVLQVGDLLFIDVNQTLPDPDPDPGGFYIEGPPLYSWDRSGVAIEEISVLRSHGRAGNPLTQIDNKIIIRTGANEDEDYDNIIYAVDENGDRTVFLSPEQLGPILRNSINWMSCDVYGNLYLSRFIVIDDDNYNIEITKFSSSGEQKAVYTIASPSYQLARANGFDINFSGTAAYIATVTSQLYRYELNEDNTTAILMTEILNGVSNPPANGVTTQAFGIKANTLACSTVNDTFFIVYFVMDVVLFPDRLFSVISYNGSPITLNSGDSYTLPDSLITGSAEVSAIDNNWIAPFTIGASFLPNSVSGTTSVTVTLSGAGTDTNNPKTTSVSGPSFVPGAGSYRLVNNNITVSATIVNNGPNSMMLGQLQNTGPHAGEYLTGSIGATQSPGRFYRYTYYVQEYNSSGNVINETQIFQEQTQRNSSGIHLGFTKLAIDDDSANVWNILVLNRDFRDEDYITYPTVDNPYSPNGTDEDQLWEIPTNGDASSLVQAHLWGDTATVAFPMWVYRSGKLYPGLGHYDENGDQLRFLGTFR